jgi:Ion channel
VTRPAEERWTGFVQRVGHAFGLVLLLVLATYALLMLTPFHGWTGVCTAAVGATAATVAMATAQASPRVVRGAVVVSVLIVLLAVIGAIVDHRPFFGIAALLEVALFAVGAAAVLAAVLRQDEVGFRTILGAVSVYVMLALLFASLYGAIDQLADAAFFGEGTTADTGDYLFFSLTTLTTTGYGNLVPAGDLGRMVAGIEMLTGQLFVVTFIAGLVSLWRPGQSLRGRRPVDEQPGL